MIAPASHDQPDKRPVKSASAKMERELLEQARMIAKRRGIKLSAYLTEVVRVGIERDWIARQGGGPG